jgi:hypothetical protein
MEAAIANSLLEIGPLEKSMIVFTMNIFIKDMKPESPENPLNYLIGHILRPEEPRKFDIESPNYWMYKMNSG